MATSGLDPDRRAKTLTEEEISKLAKVIGEMGLLVEGDLRRDTTGNLKRIQAINCYRGLRHRRGLPVRGQRTKSNARTRKGKRKTGGIMKKSTKLLFEKMTEENQTDDSAPQEDSGTHTPETSPVEENPAESGGKAVEETPDLTGAEPQSEVSDEPKEEASV